MPALNAEAPRTETIRIAFFDPEVDRPEARWLFDGLLASSDLVVWIGREKHRKTNVLLQLAFCAALGRDFMTFRYRGDQPARVVYLDYETKTASLKHRYESISRAMGLTDEERKWLARNVKIVECERFASRANHFHVFRKLMAQHKRLSFGDS